MSVKQKEISLEDEIRAAMVSDEPQDDPVVDGVIEEVDPVDEQKPEVEEPKVKGAPKDKEIDKPLEVKETVELPPVSWSGAVKAKWNELPKEVQAEIKKREDDFHKAMTAHDGELRLGRSIKEISTPYQAIIAAEGGTVEGAFKDLMNTAYVLRTGSPQQKAQVLMQAAQQFNVDLRPYMGGQQNQYNPFAAMQEEMHRLRQQADPQKIKSELQDEMERDRIKNEIEAFAANPENVYFNAFRPIIGSLIANGRAKNLQEAYEMAIWSDPSIRAEMLQKQETELAAKRKTEIDRKKKASASVTGSPGTASPSAKAPQKSLEDELREQLMASQGQAL